jgi:hypothetical protein
MRIVRFLILAAALAGCSETRKKPAGEDPGIGCTDNADCAAGHVCFQSQCVAAPSGYEGDGPAPRASLKSQQPAVDFGALGAVEARSLPITLENDGETMLELSAVRIEPATSTFRVDPMGTGPFWIRPGRTREVFVTYKPALGGAQSAVLHIESQAPTVRVSLSGR